MQIVQEKKKIRFCGESEHITKETKRQTKSIESFGRRIVSNNSWIRNGIREKLAFTPRPANPKTLVLTHVARFGFRSFVLSESFNGQKMSKNKSGLCYFNMYLLDIHTRFFRKIFCLFSFILWNFITDTNSTMCAWPSFSNVSLATTWHNGRFC